VAVEQTQAWPNRRSVVSKITKERDAAPSSCRMGRCLPRMAILLLARLASQYILQASTEYDLSVVMDGDGESVGEAGEPAEAGGLVHGPRRCQRGMLGQEAAVVSPPAVAGIGGGWG
jgi:hypothetical protein